MEQLRILYEKRYNSLSARARFVLEASGLGNFDEFYKYCIEQGKVIDFKNLKNCGDKTEKELHFFTDLAINYRKSISKIPTYNHVNFTSEMNVGFEKMFDTLSVRTKNILSGIGAASLRSFIDKVVNNETDFKLNRIRNCGAKSYNEILNLKDSVIRLLVRKDESEAENSKNDSVSRIAELKYHQAFDALPTRTKNVLNDLGANEVEGFIEKVINFENFIKLLDQRNCGEKTLSEIYEFRVKVRGILDEAKEKYPLNALFKDLEVYLLEGDVLKKPEYLLFCNYFNFIDGEKCKSLEEIGNECDLTRERVRQLSIKTLEQIKKVVVKLVSNGNYELGKYFSVNHFFISREMAYTYNETENCRFTTAFLTYVLSCIEQNDYYFVCLNEKFQNYNGIFSRKIDGIDTIACIQYMKQYIYKRRDWDIALDLQDLISGFIGKSKLINAPDKNSFCLLLKTIAKYFTAENNPIEFEEDRIVFLQNTKKFGYHYLYEILNYYRKPMHFNELYHECIKRNFPVSSPLSIHGALQNHPDIFGLKGPGIYGLIEWGGYFGTIGDVAEQILRKRKVAVDRKTLEEILCRELYISQTSIREVLFHYSHENRFIKLKNDMIGLAEWQTRNNYAQKKS